MLFVLFQWEVLSTGEESTFSRRSDCFDSTRLFQATVPSADLILIFKNSLRILSTFQGAVFRWTSWVRLRPLDGTSVWMFWPPADSHNPQNSSSVTSADWISSKFCVCRWTRSSDYQDHVAKLSMCHWYRYRRFFFCTLFTSAGLLKAYGCGRKRAEPPEIQEEVWPRAQARRLKKKFKQRDKQSLITSTSSPGQQGRTWLLKVM